MLIVDEKMIKTPVFGLYEGSKPWEDNYEKDFVRISHICISYNESEVCSLQFYYVDRQGNSLLSPLHGVDNIHFSTFKVISLDFDEFLTGICGCYGCSNRYSINSLTFMTNKRSYGPFGACLSEEFKKGGSSFNFELGDVEVFNGFHGSSNRYGITSIGLFVKPRPAAQPEPVVKMETTGW